MKIQQKVRLGEYIYRDIEENSYLNELYQLLINQYVCKVCKIKKTSRQNININDMLRFADLLSKSNVSDKKRQAYHKNLGQTIIVLLRKLYPDDIAIKYTMGSVLTNVNNYVGLQNQCKEYFNTDTYEFINEFIEKNIHKFKYDDTYFNTPQMLAFQKINELNYYSFSGATSMGKTFIIKSFIKKILIEDANKNFIVVVPTKALINEVKNLFIKEFNEILYKKGYKVITNPLAIIGNKYKYIMIYTQERMLYHIFQKNMCTVDYLFIDEAHKISEESIRSGYFYKSVELLTKSNPNIKIFFSAPNIPNPQVYLKLIPNFNYKELNYDQYSFSPVNQQKIIVDLKKNEIHIYNDLKQKFSTMELDNNFYFNEVDYIYRIGHKANNIVYCNSKKEVVELAIQLGEKIKNESISKGISELCKEIGNELHKQCFLINLLKKGICYHVGYLPATIREKIEKLYKQGEIHTIFCTSTLIEGVNLPADNLFILVKKSSYLLKDNANFKNLMGRVGRKTYNLVGNVFIVTQSSATNKEMQRCKEIIGNEVPEQKLSIENEQIFKPSIKKKIIKMLESGEIKYIKKNDISYSKYELIRLTINTLLKDVINDNKSSIVYEQFEELLSQDVISNIKKAFGKEQDDICEDSNITLDQIKNIDTCIRREKLRYPEKVEYSSILEFLKRLYKVYDWGTYESKKDIGKENRLSYYSVLLNKWMNGNKVNQIINDSIQYAIDNNEIYIEGEKREFDRSNMWHINAIINNILDDIEKVVLFKLSNYFLKFSQRCMKAQDIDCLQNDWYEYIEYGTKDRVIIQLQKIGFTRETAKNIVKLKLYNLKNTGGEAIYFTNKILKIDDNGIRNEAEEVYINYRELFETEQ